MLARNGIPPTSLDFHAYTTISETVGWRRRGRRERKRRGKWRRRKRRGKGR